MSFQPFLKEKPLLLTPGPVLLHPQIQKSLSLPMIHHRDSAFKEILLESSQKLKVFFQTQQEVLILNATGTGAMEAGLTNTLSPGEEVLCVGGGKFGERWRDMAEKLGLTVHFLDVPWGRAANPSEIKKILAKQLKIKALIMAACETSTATAQPVEETAKILRNYPEALFILDAITGLGAMPLPMDEWGVDVMVAGSQKTFWLPTGLSFISLSKKAWERNPQSKLPKYYFDLTREKKAQARGQTAFSSPVSLIRALQIGLKILEKTGLENLISQCKNFKKSLIEFCVHHNLKLYSSHPANSVTAILIEDAGHIKKNLEKNHHIIVGGGQERLKNKIIRIGHLGPIEKEDFSYALKALAQEIKQN